MRPVDAGTMCAASQLEFGHNLPKIPACRTCGTPLCHTTAPFPNSPVPKLLMNNESPSPMEEHSAREILDDAKTRLSCVKTELARIDDARRWLLGEQAILKRTITGHESIVSPCRRLPAELLSEIFSFCLPAAKVVPQPDKAPLLLTRVCRKWRAIALSTPALWTAVYFKATTSLFPSKVEEWLARAGSLPLSLNITRPRNPYLRWLSTEELKPFIATIVSRAHRWRSLHLSGRVHHEDVSNDKIPCFSHLIHLDIDVPDSRPEDLSAGSVTMFRDSPSLRSLSCAGSTVAEHLDIPWGQLSSLTIRDCGSVEAFSRIICRSTGILDVTLVISLGRPWVFSIHSPETVEHSRLRHMHVKAEAEIGHSNEDEACWDLFTQRTMTFPALQSFKFTNTNGDGTYTLFPWRDFIDFCKHSRVHLQKLSLFRLTTSLSQYSQCFDNFPSIEHLEVGEQGSRHDSSTYSDWESDSGEEHTSQQWTFTHPEVLRILDRRAYTNAVQVLPKLRTIQLHLVGLDANRCERLARVITSRIAPPADVGDPTVPRAGVDGEPLAYLERISIFSARFVVVPEDRDEIVFDLDLDLEPDWVSILQPLRRLKDSGFDISIFSGRQNTVTRIL